MKQDFKVHLMALGLLASFGMNAVAGYGSHLEPPQSVFSAFERELEYNSAVRRELCKDATDHPYFRMLVLPSFNPEFMVEILDPSVDQASVRVVMARSPIWNGGATPNNVDTSVSIATISSPTARLLKQVLDDMLKNVHFESKKFLGADGTSYYFVGSIDSQGNLEGRIWSPPPRTPTGRLVALGLLLRTLVSAPISERDGLEKEIVKSARSLLREAAGK